MNGDRRGWPRAPTALVVLAALATLGSLFAVISRSFFVFDDLYNLRLAQRKGWTLDFLTTPIFEHFAPGHRALDYLVERIFGLNFNVASAVITLLVAACSAVIYALVRRLGAGRGAAGLAAFLFATSTAQVRVGIWWAAGVDALPAAACTVAAMMVFAKPRSGWRRVAAALVLSALFAVGLLFYVKALLLPLYLVLMATLIQGRTEPLRVRLRNLADRWPELAGLAAISAPYLWWSLTLRDPRPCRQFEAWASTWPSPGSGPSPRRGGASP